MASELTVNLVEHDEHGLDCRILLPCGKEPRLVAQMVGQPFLFHIAETDFTTHQTVTKGGGGVAGLVGEP